MLPQGKVSKKEPLSRANRQRVHQKVLALSPEDTASQLDIAWNEATGEEDPFSPVCQGQILLFAGSLIYAGADGVLGADRVLDPSGTETW
jgi:hypothetical protein